MPSNSLFSEDQLRNRVMTTGLSMAEMKAREREEGRKEEKKEVEKEEARKKEGEEEEQCEEKNNSGYIIQDRLRCAVITNYPKNSMA